MNVFLTGATGYIGQHLAFALAQAGHQVQALVRSPEKANLIQHPNITLTKGEVEDAAALEKAMAGCKAVFHLAAYARVWAPDPGTYHRINVTGTENVLKAALANKVKRVVVTSTAGVFGPSGKFPVTEEQQREVPFFNEYEETKRISEEICQAYARKGLEVVVVNPSRVYGPGLGTESNPVTRMIDLYVHGSWRWIPGDGQGIGNYVYIDDVVNGHLLAYERGRSGEIYLLGGENASYDTFFQKVREISGIQRSFVRVPLRFLLLLGNLMVAWTKITGRPPLITPAWVRKYLYHWEVSSQKAIKELGYSITPLAEGIAQTIDWLKKNDRKQGLHPDHGRQFRHRQGVGTKMRLS
jgi:NAD+-dependent farnesol dehydrogenase